jgi:SAM-dependent methyltransferase
MAELPVRPIDARIYPILAEAGFSDDLFNPRQHRSCELVELYLLHVAVDLVGRLGVAPLLRHPRTVEDLLAARGFVPAFRVGLAWLLERLAAAGLVAREGTGTDRRYRLSGPLPAVERGRIRDEALATDPSYAPTFAILDEGVAIYPRVARGETTGERALFQKAHLWAAYFSNENGYYALNNRMTARAVAARLPAGGGGILEVGAGLGSATAALLEALGERGRLGDVTAYDVTEPVAFFRRRAQRTIAAAHPHVPLAFSSLDINRPWASQGVEPGTRRLVWGVNVFHLARNLDAALGEAFDALAPGGCVALGEGLRPHPGQCVGAEFPFHLLESFVDVETDPETRPTYGFLTPEQWLRALARAGFVAVETVPDVIRIRDLVPGFFAVVLWGRRP